MMVQDVATLLEGNEVGEEDHPKRMCRATESDRGPRRLRIVSFLQLGAFCVSDLAAELDMEISTFPII